MTIARFVSVHTVEELSTFTSCTRFAMVATCPGVLLRPRQARGTVATAAQSDAGETRPRAKRRVLVIGIAGASGCGKSTVAQKLAQNMGSPFTPISLDNYLMPKWMPKGNWETPAGVDFQTLTSDVKKAVNVLAQAETVPDRLLLGPSTSRSDVICKGQGGRRLNSEQVVLFLEGFLLFYQQSLAKLFQAKIWIDASLETCMQRRFKRAKGKRKKANNAEKEAWFRDQVWHHYEQYKECQLGNASDALKVDGDLPKDEVYSECLRFCTERSRKAALKKPAVVLLPKQSLPEAAKKPSPKPLPKKRPLQPREPDYPPKSHQGPDMVCDQRDPVDRKSVV